MLERLSFADKLSGISIAFKKELLANVTFTEAIKILMIIKILVMLFGELGYFYDKFQKKSIHFNGFSEMNCIFF